VTYPNNGQEIELKYPVQNGATELKGLRMRRPTARDLVMYQSHSGNSEMEAEVAMFARLCDVEEETVLNLDALDYGQLGEVYKGFFGQ